MKCKHTGPRTLIDDFSGGRARKLWMCSECGEVVGRYKRVNIAGRAFDPINRVWKMSGRPDVSEYM